MLLQVHFAPEMWSATGKHKLKPDAIPTIFGYFMKKQVQTEKIGNDDNTKSNVDNINSSTQNNTCRNEEAINEIKDKQAIGDVENKEAMDDIDNQETTDDIENEEINIKIVNLL